MGGARRGAAPAGSANDPVPIPAIRIIRDEHLSIASVLYSLRAVVRRIALQGA